MKKVCIFCEIAAGNINADIVYRNEYIMVIKDYNPQAPIHLLVIPSEHYANLMEISQNASLMSALLSECARQGVAAGGEKGFRIVVNTGLFGGQTVNHLHFHVLAGRELQWPPG